MSHKLSAIAVFIVILPFSPISFAAEPPRVELGNLVPLESAQGWGDMQVNRSVWGKPMMIGERTFPRGLGMHAPGRTVFCLEGACERFEAWIGVDAAVRGLEGGSVVFCVRGDGRELFRSKTMKADTPARHIDIPLKGVQLLELIVEDAGDGRNSDHADWAEAAIVGYPEGLPPGPAAAVHAVRGGNLVVKLSAEGRIVAIEDAKDQYPAPLLGDTHASGCRTVGEVKAALCGDGGFEFTRTLESLLDKKHACTLIERFRPTPTSVRWEIEIRGRGETWSAPIETRLAYPTTTETRFWTAWSDPELQDRRWIDPLETRPPRDMQLNYANLTARCFALPLATFLEPKADRGLSLVLSPEEILLDLRLLTRADGRLAFRHEKHRFTPQTPVRFVQDLVAHPSDWRGPVGWMVERYPDYFNPPIPAVDMMAGCGAYSADEREIDPERFRRMSFRINWKCSEDFPYMGMFLPPLADDDATWARSAETPLIPGKSPNNSFRSLNAYCKRMREQGFFVLSYFNTTEFGLNMVWPAPPRKAVEEADLWRDANDFYHAKLSTATLLSNNKPIITCYNAFVTDSGDPVYREFLLEQARRHLDRLPDSAGICIDREDWLPHYNTRADDGVSWIAGRPARSLYRSWIGTLDKLGPLMHRRGKVIFVNDTTPRIELMRQLDGFYCEYGDFSTGLNTTGLLALRKPAIAWTRSVKDLKSDPDAFFQRHLHLGVYPTAPYPYNHHSINPDPWGDQFYLDYGLLMDAMRGKKWVLAPHAVRAVGDAKVNLFEVPGGYALPVTFAGKADKVSVALRLPGLSAVKSAEVLHPGSEKSATISVTSDGADLRLEVPIVRGCAMVWLKNKGDAALFSLDNLAAFR
ncbi:MAG: NPCBM/NEW2 domain-containing protein [Pirellulales bacterium]|nr:NPCBM/NEW2 domain-containing protein [Pirellulales bacterium]